MDINFTPFPELASQRLHLRQVTYQDVNDVFAMRSNPEVMKYIPRPLAKTSQDAIDHIDLINKGITENTAINWGITLKNDDKLLGMICLIRMQPENFRTELGYILSPDAHGRGIMSEAVKAVIDYAFNVLKFHSLEAVIDPDNAASENLLIKNGFIKEAHFKENFFYEGVFLDSIIYSLVSTR